MVCSNISYRKKLFPFWEPNNSKSALVETMIGNCTAQWNYGRDHWCIVAPRHIITININKDNRLHELYLFGVVFRSVPFNYSSLRPLRVAKLGLHFGGHDCSYRRNRTLWCCAINGCCTSCKGKRDFFLCEICEIHFAIYPFNGWCDSVNGRIWVSFKMDLPCCCPYVLTRVLSHVDTNSWISFRFDHWNGQV